MFSCWAHRLFYQAYFAARARFIHGEFLHVTVTPKGSGITADELKVRVTTELSKCKAVDWGIFVLETTNTNHYHGIIHVKGATKLLKLRNNELITFLSKEGSPEGWIRYCTKEKPRFLLRYKAARIRSVRPDCINNYNI